MYHTIMRAKIRQLWRQIEGGDYRAAVRAAAPDMYFRFAGDTPISAEFRGRDEFEAWFGGVFERFPGLRLSLTDVIVRGWPWDTTVAVRLDIRATLADGTDYQNEAIQWLKIRWGRMVSDEVLEDTQRLTEALRVQAATA